MSDIIWGTVTKILSNNSFEMNVSHQKDTNKDSYQDVEEINFVEIDIPSMFEIESALLGSLVISLPIACFLPSRTSNRFNLLTSTDPRFQFDFLVKNITVVYFWLLASSS